MPKASIKAIVSEIVDECGRYLNERKYMISVNVGSLRSYWQRAGLLAEELDEHLVSRRTYLGDYWTHEDHLDLRVILDKLAKAVSRSEDCGLVAPARPLESGGIARSFAKAEAEPRRKSGGARPQSEEMIASIDSAELSNLTMAAAVPDAKYRGRRFNDDPGGTRPERPGVAGA